ncbi:phosphoinositide 3-kinase regulatory subunit 6 isoform X2 [Genypterus blacodes]|uniref:phosphoinositide 3-kinase regulatory subunit 6 isoform X2 n=1 Tax=Genypterus blacodes TaxID=154954 RepID=UPI003F766B79
MEPTGSAVTETELRNSVKALLPKGKDSQPPDQGYSIGMLRWTLHQKVQNNPAKSLILVQVLVNELEKAEKWDCHKHIIPLLHTLMYAVIQTAYIPDELYKRVYNFCKRLLTFPQPYCTLGLNYTRQTKAERSTPGLMYQRMVISEQRLRNEYHPFHERVFVLADPEVFSGSLAQVVSGDIEASSSGSGRVLSVVDHMCNVVRHSIQAALGKEQCHGGKLAQALKDMGQEVEPYFHEVLATLEQSAEEGGRGEAGALRGRLQQLYNEIVATPDSEPLSRGSLCDSPLPNPGMSFHMWTEDLDIWQVLGKWFRSTVSSSSSSSMEQEDFELGDLASDPTTPRFSVVSTDSGIEKDLPPSADPSPTTTDPASTGASGERCKNEPELPRLKRSKGFKMKPSVNDSLVQMQDTLEDQASFGGGGNGGRIGRTGGTLQRRSGMYTSFCKPQLRHYTARIVALGDDRILGQLAKACYAFRIRETRKLFLTKKVSLQFYYIPVCVDPTPISPVKEKLSKGNPCTLGSYLGMVDPWYDSNIRSLGPVLTNLAKMQQANPKQTKESFVSDVISYYVRVGRQPVHFTIYFVKICFCSTTAQPVEDVFVTNLQVDFPEFQHMAASVKGKQKKNSGEMPGAVVSMNYRKVTLSGRDVDKGLSVMMTGAQISAVPPNEAEDLNCLTLVLNESQTKSKNVKPTIRMCSIKIRTLERKSFSVTLDKDSRRRFRDVQSVEISPCLDPGYSLHKSMDSILNLGEEKDAGLSKYMSKGLSLPINTFAGIIN